MSNYPLHPNATHPPVMTCEIPLEEYESIKRENESLKAMIESLSLRADNWKTLCLISEKSNKKLVKKFVHEASIAESYRSLMYKDDALNALEKGDSVNYEFLSKKSDNCYRHANRWRRIFRKLNEEK